MWENSAVRAKEEIKNDKPLLNFVMRKIVVTSIEVEIPYGYPIIN